MQQGRKTRSSSLRSARLAAIGAALVSVLSSVVVFGPPAQVVQADPPTTGTGVAVETFTGSAVLDASWTAQGNACLTGATGPPAAGVAQINACPAVTAGRPEPPTGVTPGYLQLTRAVNNVAGSVLYNRPIPASAGVSMVFRQFQYGGTGADGIGFFLVDGSTNLTTTGANGGSLGYAQKDGSQLGIEGGYIGVGFDAYGNYYNDGEYRGTGCPVGQRSPTTNSGPIAPNVVTVRGPGAGLNGYCYLAATVPTPITNPNQPGTTLIRPLRAATLTASEREVNVRVTPDLPGSPARIIVEIRYSPNTPGDPWVPLLDIPAPAGLPSTYKFGLSSSTGGSTDVHLVRGVEVRTIQPLNALRLEKQVDRAGDALPAVITAGTAIPYQYTVTNAGAQALQNLVIVDDRIASGAITCDRTTLTVAPAIGSTAVCRGTYVVTGADVVNGVVTNIATAQALPIGIGAQVVSNPSTVTVPLVSTLQLTKSVSTPPPYSVGQPVAYSYLVQNTGGTTLYTTVVNDDRIVKPAIVNCPSSTLAPGASMTCTANYIVRAGDVGANGVLVNAARATAQTSIGQQVDSNQSTGQINVFTDVGVTKIVNDLTPLVGTNVTFTVTATNLGPSLAQGVVITDALPIDGLTFVSATPTAGTYAPTTGQWSVGTLTVGSTATLTIVATVITNVAVSNTATRTAMVQTDINPANDTAYVTLNPVPTVDHIVTKEVDRTDVPIGDQVQFTVRIQNIGPSPASGVTVSDLLPASLVFVSSSGDGSYDPVAGLWTIGNLAVSTTATLQIVATATALGTYTNLASLRSSTPPDNNSTNNSGNATVNVRNSNADLYIAKGVFPQVALVGDEVVYQVEVGNKGPDTARGVVVTDFTPAGVDLSSTVVPNVTTTTGIITFDPDGTIRWDVGELAPNQTEQATIYAVLLTPGTKVNTSIVDAPNVIDPTPDDNRDTAQLVADPRPVDIGVTKTINGASSAVVPLGTDVTFEVTARNSGPNSATNVIFNDILDPAFTIVSTQVTPGTTFVASTGDWTVPALAVNATVTLRIVATATQTGQHGNVIALSSLDQADTDPSNNVASATAVIIHEADLQIVKTNAPTTAQPGGAVIYEITVANNGPNDATGVTAYDPSIIQAQITSVDVPPGTTFDLATRVWTIGDLANGASLTLTVTIQVQGRVGASTNTVVVSTSDLPDPDPDNNIDDATLLVPAADIAVTKAAEPATVRQGDQVTFVVQVANLGPDVAQDVIVTDLLPAGLSLISATPSVGTYQAATGQWLVGTLDPEPSVALRAGPREQLVIIARADAIGQIVNTARSDRTTAYPFDPDPSNNQASAAVTVDRQPADLTITKSASPNQIAIDDTVTFTLVVTNQGPGVADQVVVDDALPTGLTPIGVSNPACTISGSTVHCVYASLAVGQTVQITITATATVAGQFTNLASAAALNPDPNPNNNAASVIGEVLEALPPQPPVPPAPPPTPPSPILPVTGNDPTAALSIASIAAALGALLVLSTRRRSQRWNH